MLVKPYLGLIIFAFLMHTTQAEIALDSTLNLHNSASIMPETGQYHIDAEFGRQYGTNLFHSFEQFNLNSGETAIFHQPTIPTQIDNVISRVTNLQPSRINGLIESEMPNADFYFINPAGIFFGPDARLDLNGGAFYGTTADYLMLGDDKSGIFSATQPNNSILTSAPPSAFGFLGIVEKPFPDIGLDQTELQADSFFLVGENITMQNSILSAPAGEISLIALGDATHETLEIENDFFEDVKLPSENLGIVQISNTLAFYDELVTRPLPPDANIHVSHEDSFAGADEVGRFSITGSEVILLNARTYAENKSNDESDKANIEINADYLLLDFSEVELITTTEFTKEGSIEISARDTEIINDSIISTIGFLDENAGDIVIKGENLYLSRSTINAAALNSEQTLPRKAGDITLDIDKNIDISPGFISVSQLNEEASETDAGTLTINAKNLSVTNGSLLLSTQFFTGEGISGKSGDINLNVEDSLIIINSDIGAFIVPEDETLSFPNRNDAIKGIGANILIKAPNSKDILIDTSRISTGLVVEAGGKIDIISGDSLKIFNSEINSEGVNEGGNIDIKINGLVVVSNSGLITRSTGNGGNIDIISEKTDSLAKTFVLLGGSSGTFLDARSSDSDGGNITIRSDGYIASGSILDASSEKGTPGEINIYSLNKKENIEEELVLTKTFITEQEEIQDLCDIRTADFQSTFEEHGGRGGVYQSPSDLTPADFCQ